MKNDDDTDQTYIAIRSQNEVNPPNIKCQKVVNDAAVAAVTRTHSRARRMYTGLFNRFLSLFGYSAVLCPLTVYTYTVISNRFISNIADGDDRSHRIVLCV